MDKVKLRSIESLKEESSRFVVPQRVTYEQNGVEKLWDMVQSHDSVGAIIYNKTSKKLVFVSQFRPPVYVRALTETSQQPLNELVKIAEKTSGSSGICLELCMGIVDDNCLSPEETVKKEILEETGFSVSSVEKIGTWIASVGLTGGKTSTFYAEVSEKDRVSSGGGCSDEGELIDVVEMSPSELKEYIDSSKTKPISTPTNVLLAYYWFMANKFQK
uniref:Uridine diphosphate glucose pyrophosphatase NUDT14 n=2 Tax=Caligus clemensi TaxID=344056 RepID=C1C086_CALCM|nr:Uridine diphosphate glucose pyrophosphatase [Caligus clemensi]